MDEDTVTHSPSKRAGTHSPAPVSPPQALQAVWVGSESPPYAVKPAATLVAEAIDATRGTWRRTSSFACKAGTEALQAAIGLVGSQKSTY